MNVENPTFNKKGSNRVMRGGDYYYGPNYLRASYRDDGSPSSRGGIGFRLVRNR